jgi:hypothetical protein
MTEVIVQRKAFYSYSTLMVANIIQIIEQLRLGRPYNQLHGSVQKYTTAVQTYTRSNEQQRKKYTTAVQKYTRSNEQQRKKNMGNTKSKRLVVNKTSQKKITRTI